MNIKLNTPVLLITYNRLDLVKQVFEKIREVKPIKLYVASDGPKKEKTNDWEKVHSVRNWIESQIDWECQFFKHFSEENKGCQMGPVAAIDWIFQFEEEAIILEDDIIPDKTFFYFCEEMLRYYKDDKRVMTISGYKKISDFHIQGDYFFSYFSPIWGWATWKRAWDLFDVTMDKWPQKRQERFLNNIFGKDASICLGKEFDKTYGKQLDAWDYPWLFSRLLNSGLGIVPKVNLIRNIGFDSEEATHTKGKALVFEVDSLKFPLKIEHNVVRNWAYDQSYEKLFFKAHPVKDIIRPYIPKRVLRIWYKYRLKDWMREENWF